MSEGQPPATTNNEEGQPGPTEEPQIDQQIVNEGDVAQGILF